MKTVAKGFSGINNSPVIPTGSGVVETIVIPIDPGISWSYTVPANQRILVIGCSFEVFAGSITTGSRTVALTLPVGIVAVPYVFNINDSVRYSFSIGTSLAYEAVLGSPYISSPLPEQLWLNTGDVIGATLQISDPDTLWTNILVRTIRYTV